MTNEERQLINECRVMIVGTGDFIIFVKKELEQIGFKDICIASKGDPSYFNSGKGIIVELVEEGLPISAEATCIPIILTFDFVEGAGAIVVFPEDEKDFLCKHKVRDWAAQYLSGYCAFWNVDNCEWLYESLPAIKEGKTSVEAKKTAAYLCARIAANIAVGRDVKHYPRFYLVEN